MNATPSGRVSGKTIRFTWTDGPTTGESHEHRFHDDGSVEYRKAGSTADYQREKRYAAERVSDEVDLVSYLAASGYSDKSIVGFASNDKQWFPVKGKFE